MYVCMYVCMYMYVYIYVFTMSCFENSCFVCNELFLSFQLHPWLYTVGYLLAFGTVLAKMWRVYYIFHNPTPIKMVSMEEVWFVEMEVEVHRRFLDQQLWKYGFYHFEWQALTLLVYVIGSFMMSFQMAFVALYNVPLSEWCDLNWSAEIERLVSCDWCVGSDCGWNCTTGDQECSTS